MDQLKPRQIPEGQSSSGDVSIEVTKRMDKSTRGEFKEKQTSKSEPQTDTRDRPTKFKEKQTCTSEPQTDIQTSVESDNPIQNNLERRAWESSGNTGFQDLTDNDNAESERRSSSRHTRPRKDLSKRSNIHSARTVVKGHCYVRL